MNRTLLVVLLAPLALIAIGCASPEERAYQVGVRNDSGSAVTVWLYKDGGPYENGWKSPEDIAVESPKAGTPIGGIVVPNGKVALAGPILGRFDSNTNAVLRVYRGARSFNEMLAIGRDSDARQDVKLQRGRNSFSVINRDGKLTVEPIADLPTTQPSAKSE